MKKARYGGFIITNYAGRQYHIMDKNYAKQIYGASKRIGKKRKRKD